MNALDELFMAETMLAAVERFADQSQDTSFIKVYDAGEQLLPDADSFVYKELRYSRDLAPVTGTNSPSKSTKPLGVIERAGNIYAIKEHVDLPAGLIMMAQGLNTSFPDPEGWLMRNLKNLVNRIQRTRNYWAAKSLLTTGGSVDLSAFPNADIASTALVYPVQTGSAVAGWDNTATKIRGSEIPTLRKAYKRATGFKPGYAFASDTVEGYLTSCAELAGVVDGGALPDLAARKVQNDYLEGGTFNRVAGLTFEFGVDDYFTDAAPDTAVPVISDADLVAILPPQSMWYDTFQQALGRVFVPTGPIGAALANGSPLGLITEQRGWSVYVELITNPIGLRLHVVWHGCLLHKQQKAVMVFNTTP